MPPNLNQQMRQILPPFLPLSVSKNLTTDNVALRADGGEGRLGGEPSARSYVKDVHTRCDMGGAQQEGHEVRRDMCENAVVLRRRLVPERQFVGHSRLRSIAPLTILGSTSRRVNARRCRTMRNGR